MFLAGEYEVPCKINGVRCSFLIDSGSNVGYVTYNTARRTKLLEQVTRYDKETVSFMDGLETFMAGVLPPVQLRITREIAITAIFKVLPENFKALNTDILPNSILKTYGCFQKFYPPGYSKLYFRKQGADFPPQLCRRLYGLKLIDDEASKCTFCSYVFGKHHKVLLDTGAYNNFATEKFMRSKDKLSELTIQICGTDLRIKACNVR